MTTTITGIERIIAPGSALPVPAAACPEMTGDAAAWRAYERSGRGRSLAPAGFGNAQDGHVAFDDVDAIFPTTASGPPTCSPPV